MRRIVVVGSSGSGKSTLAARLAARLGLAHIELDALFHRAGWEPAPIDEFRSELLTAISAAPQGWVVAGNYDDRSGNVHLPFADTVIWLDLPRRTVFWRVVRRTVRRAITREELWNGNREPMSNFVRWDPEHNMIRWTWVKYDEMRARRIANLTDGTWSHVEVYRLRSPREVDEFAEGPLVEQR